MTAATHVDIIVVLSLRVARKRVSALVWSRTSAGTVPLLSRLDITTGTVGEADSIGVVAIEASVEVSVSCVCMLCRGAWARRDAHRIVLDGVRSRQTCYSMRIRSDCNSLVHPAAAHGPHRPTLTSLDIPIRLEPGTITST